MNHDAHICAWQTHKHLAHYEWMRSNAKAQRRFYVIRKGLNREMYSNKWSTWLRGESK